MKQIENLIYDLIEISEIKEREWVANVMESKLKNDYPYIRIFNTSFPNLFASVMYAYLEYILVFKNEELIKLVNLYCAIKH